MINMIALIFSIIGLILSVLNKDLTLIIANSIFLGMNVVLFLRRLTQCK